MTNVKNYFWRRKMSKKEKLVVEHFVVIDVKQLDDLILENSKLKQQLAEKDNLIEFGREEIRKRNKRIDDIVERDKKLFNDKNKELEKLKQQLEEKDKEIEKYKERVYEHTQPFAGEDDYDDLFNDVLTHGGICAGNWLFYGKYTLSHETWDNGFCHNVLVMNIINDLKTMIKKKDEKIEELKALLNAKEKMKTQSIQGFNKLKQNQAQLAIQELEKVKEKIDCEMAIREYDISEQTADVCVSIAEQIDQQIKELKGEKE